MPSIIFTASFLNLLSTRLKRPIFHCSLREFSWVCFTGSASSASSFYLHFSYSGFRRNK